MYFAGYSPAGFTLLPDLLHHLSLPSYGHQNLSLGVKTAMRYERNTLSFVTVEAVTLDIKVIVGFTISRLAH